MYIVQPNTWNILESPVLSRMFLPVSLFIENYVILMTHAVNQRMCTYSGADR